MPMIKTRDGTHLYAKDWGGENSGPTVLLIHGWPLNADSWEYQAVPLAEAGYRVVAYDRRGFGRSEQPWTGYNYDTMADDMADVISELKLTDVSAFGFSMGGGEISRYMSRHDGRKIIKAGLISSVAPFMLKTPDNPDGVDAGVFEDMKKGLRDDRPAFLSNFFKDFYRQDVNGGVSDGVLHWSLMMSMLASPKATLDCVDAFGKTDFRPDMSAFEVPTLIVHGKKDKTVPIACSGDQAAEMIKDATYKPYDDAPHGLTATHTDQLNADMMAFLKS